MLLLITQRQSIHFQKRSSDLEVPTCIGNKISSETLPKPDIQYTLYILRCCDETLYTGITVDLERRIHEHNNSDKGAKYTRNRRPCVVVYRELLETKSAALKREIEIKKMTKAKKEALLFNSAYNML